MTSNSTPAATDIGARLSLIERLLASDPVQADAQAGELLESVPEHPMAMLFRGIARRLMGDPVTAIALLAPLSRNEQRAPLPHLQLGLALRESGDSAAAVQSLRRAVAIKPDFSDAWLALADLLTEMADPAEADRAFDMYIRHAAGDPRLLQPAALLRENRNLEAENLLRQHLERQPNDVCALCMLADAAQRHERLDRAEELLQRCLTLAPCYELARHNYAVVLMRQEKPAEALREVDCLLAAAPSNVQVLNLKAAILLRLGEYEEAAKMFERALAEDPNDAGIWASLGHVLRTLGRRDQCIDAYRRAAALSPHFGEAAWNLANLKTYRITDAELESMRTQLATSHLRPVDRIHFNFAIGKALEDRAQFGESFVHYAEGNRLQRQNIRYDADAFSGHVKRSRALFTPSFFAERAGFGTPFADPVFIVGLPRSGSTLVEQILASHSFVEGTMELPHITDIAKQLVRRSSASGDAAYPDVLASLDRDALRQLGQMYIERARNQRRQSTPFFIDKMPNNFAHVGMIQLIVPNARIIDVRRHPLACGLSLFKHLFASGQPFSYRLEDIGRYYRDYAELMAHFDAVLPGRVYRVVYERLIEDTETEVRRLLDYCKLPFEESCVRYFENTRAVATPSSEQVRTPIFRGGVDHWRKFESWLDPLKAELGPLVDSYPSASQLG